MRGFTWVSSAAFLSLIILILCGGARGRTAPAVRDGGTMKDATFRRLGKVVPGNNSHHELHHDSVSTAPIVLWRGSSPAAILYCRDQFLGAFGFGGGSQRIVKLEGEPGEGWLGRRRGPFPLVYSMLLVRMSASMDDSESFDTSNTVTADVNGDGVDELILPRQNGAIAVYSIKKLLFKQAAPPAPKGMLYQVEKTLIANLKGRDVVFLLLSLKERKGGPKADEAEVAKADPYVLWRIDRDGISRVALPVAGGPKPGTISAIGALNRPGSSTIDETLVMFDDGESHDKAYLLRLGADGSAIEPPKEVPFPLSLCDAKFIFLPETPRAILVEGSGEDAHLYFIQPEKATRWIADVKLKPLVESPDTLEILQAADPGPDPKVMVEVQPAGHSSADNSPDEVRWLYAVNREGKCFRPAPGKDAWAPLPKPDPFLRLASHSDEYGFLSIQSQPGSDILLAMFSREAGVKELTEPEVLAAADQFLQPAYVAEQRKDKLEFTPENFELHFGFSDSEDEQKERGVTEKITNFEDWRRLLPNSYQKALERMRSDLKVDFEVELASPLKNGHPILPDKYQNIEEYKVWLDGLKFDPDTIVDVIRHGRLEATYHMPGYFDSQNIYSDDFRAGKNGLTIVLPLDTAPLPKRKEPQPGFYLAQFPGKEF